MMAQTDRVSQATLSQQIFKIDLKIPKFKKAGNTINIRNLEVAKLVIQKSIIDKQIQP